VAICPLDRFLLTTSCSTGEHNLVLMLRVSFFFIL
jgi:hypothetical protein